VSRPPPLVPCLGFCFTRARALLMGTAAPLVNHRLIDYSLQRMERYSCEAMINATGWRRSCCGYPVGVRRGENRRQKAPAPALPSKPTTVVSVHVANSVRSTCLGKRQPAFDTGPGLDKETACTGVGATHEANKQRTSCSA
jgi:hypothetical protein